MKPRRPQAVLFDKDGTLFDFQKTWASFMGAFLAELADGDDTLFDALAEAVGYDSGTQRFRPGSVAVAGTPDQLILEMLPYLDGDVQRTDLTDRLNTAASDHPMQEVVDLRPFLDGLRARGLALGVATNDAVEPARSHLGASGILDLFDLVLGYDSGHGSKPGPGMPLAFAEAVELPATSIVMVGDSPHDLMAGRAAGMVTVGVLTGVAGPQDLAPLAGCRA